MLKPALRRCVARGLSLVELMVGIAVGMFVVAAAATLVATQLTENRGLQLELQVQQDLRATADIITRELRRGASLASFGDATSYVWTPGVPWIFIYNNTVATPASGVTEEVTFTQARSPGGRGSSGFRLHEEAIESLLSGSGWQPMTDVNTMKVSHFRIRVSSEEPVKIACSKLCSDGTDSCWPSVTVRAYTIELTGRSAFDARVVRSLSSHVRVRSEILNMVDPLAARTCPA